MRTVSAIIYDIKFQIRHGFYYAYLLVTLLYILLLRIIPADTREYISIIILLTDPTVLGFFFIGGIVLLEKDQNIFASLFVTPMKVEEYITAKLASLTLLSLLSSSAIAFFSNAGSINAILFLAAVASGSVFFTLAGIVLAVRVKSINGYIIASPLFLTLFTLPLFGFLRMFESPIYNLLPAYSTLQLLAGAYNGITFTDALYAVVLIGIWDILAYIWACKWFSKYIIEGIGGGGK